MRLRAGPPVLLILALGAISWLTLKPIPEQGEATQLTPWSCLFCGPQGTADVLLNIALFVPLGAALAWLGSGRLKALALGASLSLAIELAQATLVPGRDPALGDLLANTVGTAAGALLALAWPGVWRPSASRARRLATAAGVAWLLMTAATGWLVLPAPVPDRPIVLVAPDHPLGQAFAGRVSGVTVNGGGFDEGPLPAAAASRLDPGRVQLGAKVVTGSLPERVAPLVELTSTDSTVWARLAQLGQKGTFAVRLRSTRIRLMTPEVRVHRAIPMVGSVAADFRGSIQQATLIAEVTVDDSTHRHERALTPGLGWALVLPFNYPLDHMGAWPSAIWLALTLLPFGFWQGRSRLPLAWAMAASIALLSLGIHGSAALLQLRNDGFAAWLCCIAALLLGWLLAYGRIDHEDTKDTKGPALNTRQSLARHRQPAHDANASPGRK